MTSVSLHDIFKRGYRPLSNLSQAFPTRHLNSGGISLPCTPYIRELCLNFHPMLTLPGTNSDFAQSLDYRDRYRMGQSNDFCSPVCPPERAAISRGNRPSLQSMGKLLCLPDALLTQVFVVPSHVASGYIRGGLPVSYQKYCSSIHT